MTNAEYKEMLINNILEWQTDNQFTREQLEKNLLECWKEYTIMYSQ